MSITVKGCKLCGKPATCEFFGEQRCQEHGPKLLFSPHLTQDYWPPLNTRDHFAMAAMSGLLTKYPLLLLPQEAPIVLARVAYEVADAMLKERERPPDA